MIDYSLEHIAHNLQQVCSWAPDNQAVKEEHVTQIVQTGLNMPSACRGGIGKGLFTFIPHRQMPINKFRDLLRKHPGCNLDTTFNYCKTAIVFGICPGKSDPNPDFFPIDHKSISGTEQQRIEKKWWNECYSRLSQKSPLGEEIPYWLKNQLVQHMCALTASALEAKRLGYAVQFLTCDVMTKDFYKEYPDLIGKPYIPMHCLLLGTSPESVKISHRRNRAYRSVNHTDAVIEFDNIASDAELHFEFDDFRMTPNQHLLRKRKGAYKSI